MNYYERWCADYVKKTLGLRMIEHGAYTRLLDAYYIGNGPLPDHFETLCTIAGAVSRNEVAAVRKIADDYFPLGSDGMRHNERADEEIQKYYKRIGASQANGSKGGRPKKANPAGSVEKPNGNPMGYPARNPAHNPATKLTETPSHISTSEPKGTKPLPDFPDGKSSSGEAPDIETQPVNGKGNPKAHAMGQAARAILVFLNAKTGKRFPPSDSNVGIIVARFREGFTFDQVRAVVAMKCREWNDNEWRKYLTPETLFRRSKFSTYVGELGTDDDASDDEPGITREREES